MKTIWILLLERAISALLKSDWEQVNVWVQSYLLSDMPGDEKRKRVFLELRNLGSNAATWLLYAAIEIAYGKIKEEE